jgi:hypothetical protein
MASLDELIELEDRLKPKLLRKDYTFIGPQDQGLLGPFIRTANEIAPIVAISRELRHVLGNRNAVLKAISMLPPGTKLRIYVVDGRSSDLFHDTVEDYCKENGITI